MERKLKSAIDLWSTKGRFCPLLNPCCIPLHLRPHFLFNIVVQHSPLQLCTHNCSPLMSGSVKNIIIKLFLLDHLPWEEQDTYVTSTLSYELTAASWWKYQVKLSFLKYGQIQAEALILWGPGCQTVPGIINNTLKNESHINKLKGC